MKSSLPDETSRYPSLLLPELESRAYFSYIKNIIISISLVLLVCLLVLLIWVLLFVIVGLYGLN